jgi:hypothetical protein
MRKRFSLALLAILLFSGCGVTTPDYTAPQSSASIDKTTVALDQSYDETWDQLINFTSSRFFAIDNYEKDSGLMTLSFSSEPGRFVECGEISTDGPPAYEGDYVQWFSERPATLDLDGRMNLNVREAGENETEVDVNVRYVVTATGANGVQAAQWSFNTGGSDTQQVRANNFGATQTRTCQPTHEAEKVIIDGIR